VQYRSQSYIQGLGGSFLSGPFSMSSLLKANAALFRAFRERKDNILLVQELIHTMREIKVQIDDPIDPGPEA